MTVRLKLESAQLIADWLVCWSTEWDQLGDKEPWRTVMPSIECRYSAVGTAGWMSVVLFIFCFHFGLCAPRSRTTMSLLQKDGGYCLNGSLRRVIRHISWCRCQSCCQRGHNLVSTLTSKLLLCYRVQLCCVMEVGEIGR